MPHAHTHTPTHPPTHTHTHAALLLHSQPCWNRAKPWRIFLSGSPAESMQTSLSKKHNPRLGSTQLLLCSSQRANLRLALDLLPKMAGLELAHPQAPKRSHLATWKTRFGGIFPAVTAFILLNLARGVQRVMPGLFTPAGMNPPMLRVQRRVQLLLTIRHLRQSVGSESSFFCSSVSVFFPWKNHEILSSWLIHESEDVCVCISMKTCRRNNSLCSLLFSKIQVLRSTSAASQ